MLLTFRSFILQVLLLFLIRPPAISQQIFPLLHQDVLPPNYFLSRLSNGLQILVIEDLRQPVAHVQARIKLPDLNPDSRDRSLAHFYEHLLFAANDRYFLTEMLHTRFHELGILHETGIRQESIFAEIHVSNQHTAAAIEILGSCLMEPRFDKDDLKHAREEIVEELSANETQPVYFLQQELQGRIFGEYSKLRFPEGTYPEIAMSESRELFEFHLRYIQPQALLIAVAGDVHHEEVFEWTKEEFRLWNSPDENLRIPKYPRIDKPAKPGFFIVENMLVNFPVAIAAWPGPDLWKDERGCLSAKIFIELVNHLDSPLMQAVKKTEYAYNCNFHFEEQRSLGMVNLAIIPEPGKTGQLLDTLFDVLGAMGEGVWFDEDEFSRAKSRVVYDMRMKNESLLAKLDASCQAWAASSIVYFAGFREQIEQIRPWDIYDFYRRYILETPVALGITASGDQRESYKLDSVLAAIRARPDSASRKTISTPVPHTEHQDTSIRPITLPGDTSAMPKQIQNYRIFFERGSSRPEKSSLEALDLVAVYLRNHPTEKIHIAGHTDTRGSEEYNQMLSLERAESIKNLLSASFGVNPEQMEVSGFGEKFPAFPEMSASQIQGNRRVEISIVGK